MMRIPDGIAERIKKLQNDFVALKTYQPSGSDTYQPARTYLTTTIQRDASNGQKPHRVVFTPEDTKYRSGFAFALVVSRGAGIDASDEYVRVASSGTKQKWNRYITMGDGVSYTFCVFSTTPGTLSIEYY